MKLDHAETREQLAAFAAGTLSAEERAAVAAHLRECAVCAREAAEWASIRGAVRQAAPEAILRPHVLSNIHARIATAETHVDAPVLWQLLLAQIPLVRRQIWTASALVLTLGVGVTLALRYGADAFLVLLAPLVAAIGIAFIYGPENDAPLEITLATPTSPRLILLARLTLVFGYNFLLGLLCSTLIALNGHAMVAVQLLLMQWLGPMLLLSAISLAASLRLGSTAGVGIAVTLWGVRVMMTSSAMQLNLAMQQSLAVLNSTNVFTVVLAALILLVAVGWLPNQEQFA